MGERKYNKELKSELLNEISALTLAVQELTEQLKRRSIGKGSKALSSSAKRSSSEEAAKAEEEVKFITIVEDLKSSIDESLKKAEADGAGGGRVPYAIAIAAFNAKNSLQKLDELKRVEVTPPVEKVLDKYQNGRIEGNNEQQLEKIRDFADGWKTQIKIENTSKWIPVDPIKYQHPQSDNLKLGKELGSVWGTGVSVDHCRFYDEVITAQKAISNLSTSPDWKIRPGMEILNVDVKNEDIAIIVTKALAGGLRDKFSGSVAVSPSIEEEVAKVFDDRRDKKTRMRDFLSALGRWEYELYPRLKAVLDKRDSSGRTLYYHLQQIPKEVEDYMEGISPWEDLSVANDIVTNRIKGKVQRVRNLKIIEGNYDIGVLTPSIKEVCDRVSKDLRVAENLTYNFEDWKLFIEVTIDDLNDTAIGWMEQIKQLERKLSASPQVD